MASFARPHRDCKEQRGLSVHSSNVCGTVSVCVQQQVFQAQIVEGFQLLRTELARRTARTRSDVGRPFVAA